MEAPRTYRFVARGKSLELGRRTAIMGIVNVTPDSFYSESRLPDPKAARDHALKLAEDGYTVYWAIYTKRVNWFTPVYLTLIDPFRWVFVYPAVIKRLERAWATTYTQRINTFQ